MLGLAGVLIVLLAGAVYPTAATAQTVVSCPFTGTGGDNLSRGVYVTNYAGTNIDQVTLAYDTSTAGTYMITLTARAGTYNGPIIGTHTVGASLPNSSSTTPVSFPFSGAAVTQGSTITFTQSATGPGGLGFDTGNGPCPGVTETSHTNPPLDTFRRNSVGLTITQVPPVTLTVNKTGSGAGAVTSSPGGINCGATCLAAFNYGSTVTLTASPASGSTFAGWSGGGCSGTATCTVAMNAAQAVTAAFNAIPQPKPVQISGASETHKKFRVSHSPKLAQISKKLAPIGTKFKFTLNGAAKVRLDFRESGAGRKVNGKCVAPSKHNKHKAKCALLAGSRTFSGHAGTNRVVFKGWLSHSKKLKPGHYTLAITAITPGVGSTSRKLTFRIVG